jgi:hypothetical protein
LKNNNDLEAEIASIDQPEAAELKRRATEDAFKDADSFAMHSRMERKKVPGASASDLISYLLKTKQAPARVGPQDGIDGLFIHPSESAAKLVLSDELQKVSLEDEVAALATEPIRIFHVQAPAPWVEQVLPGNA